MDNAATTALEIVDRLLLERPERVGEDFSAATSCIAAYRDQLIAQCRTTSSETDRQRLARINAVLSVIVGGHYPLTGVPWDAIQLARNQLAAAAKVPGPTSA